MKVVDTLKLVLVPSKKVIEVCERDFYPVKNPKYFVYVKKQENGVKYQYLKTFNYLIIVITPIKLLEYNGIKVNDVFQQLESINRLLTENYKTIFNIELIDDIKLSRIDFAIDVNLNSTQREQYLKLYDKSLKKTKWMKRKKYPENNLYYSGKSHTINIYDKYIERSTNSGNVNDIEMDNYQFIRVEVQVKSPKIRYNKRFYGVTPVIENYYTIEDRNLYLEKYARSLFFHGDHYDLYRAKQIISQHYSKCMIKRLLAYMSYISKYGAQKAIDKYGAQTFNAYKKRLESIQVNPILIPKNWGIHYMKNLLDLAYEQEKADNNASI